MRQYLGIEMTAEVKDSLSAQISDLQHDYAVFHWTSPESYAIPLFHFGSESVEELTPLIEDALFEQPEFVLYPLHLEIAISRNILIYLTFYREKAMEQLVANVADHYIPGKNYSYAPSITLATYKKPSKQQYFHLKKKLERTEIEFEWKVDTVSLIRAEQKGKRSTYTKLKDYKLLPRE
ncbi:hypothetical protein HGB07_09225 [Candidatus Roizmanbacteria bacterium]|nr:hypothetical protein [Candidatus Roizmanbacteria bacterium]